MKQTKVSLVAVLGGGLAACSLLLAGPAAAAPHTGPGVSGSSVGSNEAAQPAASTDHPIGLELPIAPVGAADHTIGLELPIAPVGAADPGQGSHQ